MPAACIATSSRPLASVPSAVRLASSAVTGATSMARRGVVEQDVEHGVLEPVMSLAQVVELLDEGEDGEDRDQRAEREQVLAHQGEADVAIEGA